MPTSREEDTYEPAQVPLRTVFNLLDRDGSSTIDAREFCAVLQALTPTRDLQLSKLIHCFPTCVLRPRDAEDERRLLGMIVAPRERGSPEEVALNFDTFVEKWESLPENTHDEVGFGRAMQHLIRQSSSGRGESGRKRSVAPETSSDDGEKKDEAPTISMLGSFAEGATVHPRVEAKEEPRASKKPRPTTAESASSFPLVRQSSASPTNLEIRCSFRRRQLRRARSIHADWEIDSNELEIGRSLGGGKFGLVREALWRGAPVAVKRLKASVLTSENNEAVVRFDREICLLANMRHPNILMFMGAVMNCDEGNVMVVTERLDLSLHDLLYEQEPPVALTRATWYSVCEQICRGLNYIHLSDPPIIHRDIKPKNVLIRRPLHIKLADFGISIAREKESDQIIGLAGTLPYMAPELLRNEPYSEKVDVYSFAMVAYEALTRSRPLLNEPPMRIILSVGIHGHRPKLPPDTPDDIRTIIRSAWAQEPTSRPSAEQVLGYIRQASARDPLSPASQPFQMPVPAVRHAAGFSQETTSPLTNESDLGAKAFNAIKPINPQSTAAMHVPPYDSSKIALANDDTDVVDATTVTRC
ncbi:hypothetical protein CTAYLR_007584 [Chrysophaeum taylorii]|uniref:Uncharacterized protein n=1 Tax=Chrysophaeum taylorii TaxID=2483200 RepID=A0AAD7UE85_9STRA|nr:hypothetical protein CTAYLR_007584 [Chrysophaeum taylorii]